MNGLFTTISGFFSRSLILGTFSPTVVFVTLFTILVVSLFPGDYWLVEQLKTLGSEWSLVTLSFFTVVICGLLYNLNSSIIRFYEGYPWKNTWIGKARQKHYQNKFKKLDAQTKGLRALIRVMNNPLGKNESELNNEEKLELEKKKQKVAEQLKDLLPKNQFLLFNSRAYRELLKNSTDDLNQNWENWLTNLRRVRDEKNRRCLNTFPTKEGLILPTSLGNIIRSFEYYPDRQYKIDAIAIYPRLIAKIDKDYAAVIDDAKTGFDFMLNSSLLSLILAVLLVAAGLIIKIQTQSFSTQLIWTGEIFALIVLSRFAYQGAKGRAAAWGDTIKSSFDLYRNDLLLQLGYPDKPKTKVSERELWNNISLQILDGDLPEGPVADYDELTVQTPSTYLEVTPAAVKVTILRTFSYLEHENAYQVNLLIRNEDEKTSAQNVLAIDTLPEGFLLKQNSIKLFRTAPNTPNNEQEFVPVKVSGINPYTFTVGQLAANEEKIVCYQIISLTKLSTKPIIIKQHFIQKGDMMNYFDFAVHILMKSVEEVLGNRDFTLNSKLQDLGLTDFSDKQKIKRSVSYYLFNEFFYYFPNLRDQVSDSKLKSITQQIETEVNTSPTASVISIAENISTFLTASLPGDSTSTGKD